MGLKRLFVSPADLLGASVSFGGRVLLTLIVTFELEHAIARYSFVEGSYSATHLLAGNDDVWRPF